MFGRLQSDEKLYKDFCATHVKLSKSLHDEGLKKKTIKSPTEMLRRNELGINQYSNKFRSNKEYAIFKEAPASELQFSHLVVENPTWTDDVADFYAFTRTCHEFVRLAPSHGKSGKYFFEKIDLSAQFFLSNDPQETAKKLYQVAKEIENNEHIPLGFILNRDSEVEPKILVKTGELIANQFKTKFTLFSQINNIEIENLSENCFNFMLGYLTSTSTTFIQRIGGRLGSTDSKNLLLIIYGNIFSENRKEKFFEYTITQMQTKKKNSDFLLGLNAGGLDASAFINGEKSSHKNLMDNLSRYSP